MKIAMKSLEINHCLRVDRVKWMSGELLFDGLLNFKNLSLKNEPETWALNE
jgi:hypothetical protein